MGPSVVLLHELRRDRLDYFGVRFIPELVPQAHRNTPVCHGATRIIDGDLGEFLFSFFVPEGMKQRHAALKRLLNAGAQDTGNMTVPNCAVVKSSW